MNAIDPVHKDDDDGEWYFWIETWADRYGPYINEDTARKEFERYCREVLGP